eukprot:5110592-Ditylum_brightwellii.AAC.2
MDATTKACIVCDIMSVWQAVDNGVTHQTSKKRQKYWSHWQAYTRKFGQNVYLSDATNLEQQIIITAFAAQVQSGHCSRGTQVKVSSVAEALVVISKTIKLDGERSPICKEVGKYVLPLEQCMESFRCEDPPAIPQLALLVGVVQECFCLAKEEQKKQSLATTANLAVITFYYLLRGGKYTKLRTISYKGGR